MTIDGFLTALALAAAVFAVVPPVQRLRLKLILAYQLPLGLLAVGLVLYFEFFNVVQQPCWEVFRPVCPWITLPADEKRFSPQQAAFIVAIAWIATALILPKLFGVGSRSMSTLLEIVEKLHEEQRYADLISFIEPHLKLVARSTNRHFENRKLGDDAITIAPNLWHRLINTPTLQHLREHTTSTVRRLMASIAPIIPDQGTAETHASNILHVMYRSESVRRYITKFRPYTGLALLNVDCWETNDFSDGFFLDLISETSSILYEEIRNNQNMEFSRGYFIPDRNRILRFAFDDANVAKDFAVYKPVGDFVIQSLRPGQNVQLISALTGSYEADPDFSCKEPVSTALFFFDIMVRAAALQGVRWHMWLQYLYLFIDELVKLRPSSFNDEAYYSEFPDKISFLAYRAASHLVEWVTLVRHLPKENHHVLVQPDQERDNSSIPISAAYAVGVACHKIFMGNFTDRTMRAFHENLIRGIAELQLKGPHANMRQLLIRCVINGGQFRQDPAYMRKLRDLFEGVDHFMAIELPDYAKALGIDTR